MKRRIAATMLFLALFSLGLFQAQAQSPNSSYEIVFIALPYAPFSGNFLNPQNGLIRMTHYDVLTQKLTYIDSEFAPYPLSVSPDGTKLIVSRPKGQAVASIYQVRRWHLSQFGAQACPENP
jgi:hypothetical protein